MSPRIVYMLFLVATIVACVALVSAELTQDEIKKAGEETAPEGNSLVDRAVRGLSGFMEKLEGAGE